MPALPFAYDSFTGGINTKDAAFDLIDNEARDLSNVQGTTAGAIVKRNGLSTFSSPAVTLTSLFASEATASLFLIGAGATSLYKVTTGGVASAIKTGLTNNARWEFVSAPVVGGQGPVFGVNGTDTPQQWDGVAGTTSNWTNASGAVAVPNGKYLTYANNQVFVAGVASAPSTVFWSAIADPTNWDPASLTGAGSVQFDPNDGQQITGIGRVGPYVLVCKPRKLWVIVDVPNAATRRLSDNVGCVAHRSIASGPNGTYLLAEDRGVYLTNGSKLSPISDKIQPTVDAVGAQRSQAVGVCIGGHYYLSISATGSGANDTTLDWDETLQSWWKHSFGSNQFAVWHPTGTALLYSAKSTAAIVDQCFAANVFQDNGANFQWVWRGPWQSPSFYRRRRFPTPYFRKRLRQIRIKGQGVVDYSLALDFAVTETLKAPDVFVYSGSTDTYGVDGTWADAGTYAGGATIKEARVYSGPVAEAFSIVLGGTNNAAATVLMYVLMMTDRRDGQT